MNKIICLSTSPWYPIPTRKQQVMSRLPDAEILYFDPPITYLAPLKDKSARAQLRAYRRAPQQVGDHITVYSLPPVLPFFNKFRWVNRLNQRRIARFVNKKAAEHGFNQPVLWCYSPTACDSAPRIAHRALVYDCVDLHSAYGGLMNPAVVDRMEFDLAAQADQVFATATRLAARLKAVNPTAEMIPNGANYERFAAAAEEQPCPEDLKAIPQPIFGFVGALQACIEYDWVEHAAKSRPDWSFVFIGGEKPGVDLSALHALPNVHFLGLKPNEQLPAYLHHFTACLNLFGNNELSQDVSPLKFYEYLATGRPIVSTPQPDQVLQYEGLIRVARTADEFVAACEAAITDDGQEKARMEEGRRCSWDARVAQICEILKAKEIFQ
jgi:glycosyltransferase involved in cell wall biosynthesis